MSKIQCTAFDQAPSGFAQPPAGLVGRLVRLPLAALETLLVWQERASQRVQLQRMDDHMLADIGLSRADVEHEVSVPFWRQL